MAYSDRVTVLHALANTLKRARITDKVTIIAKAKVPIVKFVTTHGYFPVDISINQENGIEAGRMVSGFLSEMPALRALVLVVKAFLRQRSMNEVFTGGLGSYSIICLAVSFLQMHPKIRRGEIDPGRNLGVLVMEFFEFYGLYFNYHEVGISLRDGGNYFSKAQRGWMDYKQSLLSIEDPADASELYVAYAECGAECVISRCSKRYSQGIIQYRTSAPDIRRRTQYHDSSRIYEG
jgi:non-canonical poly(A) RNA polymerase PAPD5/7